MWSEHVLLHSRLKVTPCYYETQYPGPSLACTPTPHVTMTQPRIRTITRRYIKHSVR